MSPEQRKMSTTTGDWKVGSSPPPPGRLPTPPRCPTANEVRRHRAWTGHWNRRGAQQPAPRAPPRLPAATAKPPASTGLDGSGGLEVELEHRGCIHHEEDVQQPPMPLRARRWPPRQLAAGPPPRTPPPPSPPGLRPMGPPTLARGRGRWERGRGAGGGGAPMSPRVKRRGAGGRSVLRSR
jgi:hypothetical protein